MQLEKISKKMIYSIDIKISKVIARKFAKYLPSLTCSQVPWAANGLSGVTRVPATLETTKVTAVSSRTDLRVKWKPCFSLPCTQRGR